MQRSLLIIVTLILALSGCATEQIMEDKNYTARQQIEAGKIYLKSKKYLKAEKAFKKAIELDPTNEYPYILTGEALRKDGNYKASLEYYQQASELNPNSIIAIGNIGMILKLIKRYDGAIMAFKKVLAIDPKEIKALDNLADTYYFLNDFTNCQIYIDKFEAVVATLDVSLMSEKKKISIEKSRRTFAMYTKVIADNIANNQVQD